MRRDLVGVAFAGIGAFVVAACTLSGPRPPAADGGAPTGAGGGTVAGRSATGDGGADGKDGVEQVPGQAGAPEGQAGSCQGGDCANCASATPAPGTSCGQCGKYVCNPDGTTTSCVEPPLNACGGCAELASAPGEACGECGKYECAADKESVSCGDAKKNACGGCGALASAPNSSCGSCGDWQCSTDKTEVRCTGVNANACGGCGTLAQPPGGACGACGKYECSPDKSQTNCNDPGLNACGGCMPLTGTLGGACGPCSLNKCASDKNSFTCKSSCNAGQVCVSGPNQCKTADCSAADSCGNSDGAGSTCTGASGKCTPKPGASGSCVGSSCVYACNGPTLSCSTASQPACGSWDFESNGTEGWSLSNRTDSASSGDVYVATPPGSGAGAHSLALAIDSASGAKSLIEIETNLCNGVDATGIQGAFHASVWFKPSDGLGAAAGPASAYPFRSGGSNVGGVDSAVPANQWFDVATNAIAGEGEVGVVVRVSGLGNRKGVLYFDNMRFQ